MGASGRQSQHSWSDAGLCLQWEQFHIQQKVRRTPQLAGTLEEMDSSPMLKADILVGAAHSWSSDSFGQKCSSECQRDETPCLPSLLLLFKVTV